jgi:flagellar assembly protein FliH
MIIKRKVSKIKDEINEEAVESTEEVVEPVETPEEIAQREEQEVFDIDKIDFTQRSERRTGNRRRGYRRIDDRNLVSRAQEEAVQIRQNAYQEGYNQGLQQAHAEIQDFKNVLGAFLNAEERVFQEIAPNVLELGLDIAKKIIKHEVKTDIQIVEDTVMDAIRILSKNEPKVVLRVNPIQVQYLKDTLPDKIRSLGMETKLSVLSDEAVSEGGCIIQTNNGMIDATVEAQLGIVQMALRSFE